MIVFIIACFSVGALCLLIGIGVLGTKNTMRYDIMSIGAEEIEVHTRLICLRARFIIDCGSNVEELLAVKKSMILVISNNAHRKWLSSWKHG